MGPKGSQAPCRLRWFEKAARALEAHLLYQLPLGFEFAGAGWLHCPERFHSIS